MSLKARESEKMELGLEASDLIGAIAGGGSSKQKTLRAFRLLRVAFPQSRWTFNRVHDLFTRDQRARVHGDEIEQLRQVARRHAQITLARSEYEQLIERIERCEKLLAGRPADMARPAAHAAQPMARPQNSALDRGAR